MKTKEKIIASFTEAFGETILPRAIANSLAKVIITKLSLQSLESASRYLTTMKQEKEEKKKKMKNQGRSEGRIIANQRNDQNNHRHHHDHHNNKNKENNNNNHQQRNNNNKQKNSLRRGRELTRDPLSHDPNARSPSTRSSASNTTRKSGRSVNFNDNNNYENNINTYRRKGRRHQGSGERRHQKRSPSRSFRG